MHHAGTFKHCTGRQNLIVHGMIYLKARRDAAR
jgi:hypothetical protein